MRPLFLLITLMLAHLLHAQGLYPRTPRMHRHPIKVVPHVQLVPATPGFPIRDTLNTDDTLRVMVSGEVMVVPAFDPRVPVHGFQRKVDGEWQDLQPLPRRIRKRDHYYRHHDGPSMGLVPAEGNRPATGGLWAPGEYRVVMLERGKKPLFSQPFHVVAR
ncbi:MAG TPA: hypothetical protein PLB89_10145 [Flavobacteriales bacterium]|nr:hypothetical protein [Flavobacteriales bacterium]